MADYPYGAAGGDQDAPGQQASPNPGYTSPVFDLHTPGTNQPVYVNPNTRFDPQAPMPGTRVKIGEEEIQIAPHPTTNRFPWAPVNNPTVPVYGTVPDQQVPPPPPPPMPAGSSRRPGAAASR